MYLYSLYGLTLGSELELPELTAVPAGADQVPDVLIRCAAVTPPPREEGDIDDGAYWATRDQFWLPVEGVAGYRVEHGNRITIDRAPGIDDASVRLFLLGSGIGALLFQRELLVLHGNAIRVGDACLVCVGDSGIGKSTLAAAFMQQGHQILADDVVPVTTDGMAIPGMPRIKLWQDAADRLGLSTDGLRRIMPEMDKYNFPLGERFCGEPLPLRWVYLLTEGEEGSETIVEEVTGLERFRVLCENTYRLHYLRGMGLQQAHLQQCAALASKIRVKKITRPPAGAEPGDLVQLILADA